VDLATRVDWKSSTVDIGAQRVTTFLTTALPSWLVSCSALGKFPCLTVIFHASNY